MGEQRISLTVNGQARNSSAEQRMSLADFLRECLGLTGTHLGCEHGVCGACTIICDGEAVRSCLMFAVQAEGTEIKTIEGLADGTNMHPLQKLFSEQRALQCGFCTPGQVMSAVALLDANPNPTREEVRYAMSGNLCRCGAYDHYLNSVMRAAKA